MPSRFLKGDTQCLSCGSSLLRADEDSAGVRRVSCFVCNAGELVWREMEAAGLDLDSFCQLVGREEGLVHKLLPRINTPGKSFSTLVTGEYAARMIRETFRLKHDLPH